MDTLIFLVAQAVGLLIRPDSWLVLGIALAGLGLWRGRLRLARRALAATLVFGLAVALLPIGNWLLAGLESRYPVPPPPDRIDGIVVLGGGENLAASARWGAPQLNQAADRLVTAAALARNHPDAVVLFAGGSGRLRDLAGVELSEAAMAARILTSLGLEPDRLRLEDRSRNTAENARRSRALADPQEGEVWVLVTSAFHMPRAVRSFEAAGWATLLPWPVDFRSSATADALGWNLAGNLATMDTALREHVGALAYALLRR